jgi:fluoride ion exporter CrcB/FEX
LGTLIVNILGCALIGLIFRDAHRPFYALP